MSKIKSILSLYAMAAMAMSGDLNTNYREERIKPKESDEDCKKRLAKAEIERNKANGLQEFFYGENSLWALNKKVADKKAAKRNWI